LKRDSTRAETRFRLSPKRTSPFKSAGASVQSNAGSRGVRISVSNDGYTMFRGSEGYLLPTPFASFPFTSPLPSLIVSSHCPDSVTFNNSFPQTCLYLFCRSLSGYSFGSHPPCSSSQGHFGVCLIHRLYNVPNPFQL